MGRRHNRICVIGGRFCHRCRNRSICRPTGRGRRFAARAARRLTWWPDAQPRLRLRRWRARTARPRSPFLTALSVYALSSLSGQRDLILGIPVEGRPDRESRSVIGLCAETVPLRVTVQPEEGFGALVDRVRSGLAEVLDCLDCPFDRIVEAVDAPSRPDRSILFDAMVSYRMTDGEASPKGVEIAPLPLPVQGSQLDLSLLFSQTARGADPFAAI